MANDIVEADLLREIEQFCEINEMSLTDFGRHSLNDSGLVTTLRAGRELRSKTRQKIRSYMDQGQQAAE